jgi:hypothetical protein
LNKTTNKNSDGMYVCEIEKFKCSVTPSKTVSDYGFRLLIDIKDVTGGSNKKITLTKPILITN